MFTFATDYFILVFVATIGVIQFSASTSGLNGLLFFKSHFVSRFLGLALVVIAFIWFFSVEERNINDYEGGLDAPTQAFFFFLGAISGGSLTFLLSSLFNSNMKRKERQPESGLEALRETNYIRAVYSSIKYWRREWRTQTKKYFFG